MYTFKRQPFEHPVNKQVQYEHIKKNSPIFFYTD
jgi:hypothetical protein